MQERPPSSRRTTISAGAAKAASQTNTATIAGTSTGLDTTLTVGAVTAASVTLDSSSAGAVARGNIKNVTAV